MGGGGGVGVGWKSLGACQPILAWQEENPTLIIILLMQKSNTLMNDGWAVTMTILDDVDDGVGGGEGRKGNYGCRWRRGPSSSGAYQLVFEGVFQNGL